MRAALRQDYGRREVLFPLYRSSLSPAWKGEGGRERGARGGASRYTGHIGVSSPYHLSTLPSARGRSWIASAVEAEGAVGGGEGATTERQDGRRELEGSVGGGQGVRVRLVGASRSHSRSSTTTVLHDSQSDPTTASVYGPHPHSQQPLVTISTGEGSTKLRASPIRGFRSLCKSEGRPGEVRRFRVLGCTLFYVTVCIAFPLGDTRVELSVQDEEDETRRIIDNAAERIGSSLFSKDFFG